jgi:hypothetical protein
LPESHSFSTFFVIVTLQVINTTCQK